MCVSEKDTEVLEKIRSYKDEFKEIESATDGKIAFEMNEEFFGKELLKKAGFKGLYATKPDFMSLEEAMKPSSAKLNIKNALASAHLETLIG